MNRASRRKDNPNDFVSSPSHMNTTQDELRRERRRAYWREWQRRPERKAYRAAWQKSPRGCHKTMQYRFRAYMRRLNARLQAGCIKLGWACPPPYDPRPYSELDRERFPGPTRGAIQEELEFLRACARLSSQERQCVLPVGSA